MHNVGIVIGFEFGRTIRRRSFWLAALAFPILIVVIGAISYFSNIAADREIDAAETEGIVFVVNDASGLVTDEALEAFGAGTVDSREEGIDQVVSGAVDAFVFYPADPLADPIEVYGQELSIADNGRYEFLAREILDISLVSEISSPERRALLDQGFSTSLTTYEEGVEAVGWRGMIAPGLFLVLFFILLVLLGNQMLNSVTEEKENRVIEMLLATVTARALIVGKIISLALLGLIQVALILVPVAAALILFGDVLEISLDLSELVLDPVRIAVGAVLLVLSYMVVTGVLVTVSAAMPTAKEAGSFLGFAIFATVIPFYAIWPIITDPGQIIVQVFTYFPLTSPVTMLMRNAVGNLGTMELILGIAILTASAALALASAIRAFRRGTLQYERRLSVKELFGRS